MEYGGSGAGMVGLALAMEEVSKYDSTAGLILMLSVLSTQTVRMFGTEEQRQALIPPIARGETRGALALTEPDAGSDVASMSALAVRDGDHWVLNGQKQYVSGAPVADHITVFAKTDAGDPRSLAVFVVDRASTGLEVTRVERLMGVRGMPTALITFRDVRIPQERMIGGTPLGMRAPLATLNAIRPVVGARGIGLAEGALTYALRFAKERRAFGGTLTDLQAIQMKFADMAIDIEAARLLVHQACWLVDNGRYGPAEAPLISAAKTFATEMANRVASEALQILGGRGYSTDHPLERHYRDARQLLIVEGTSEIQRSIVARAVVDGTLAYD